MNDDRGWQPLGSGELIHLDGDLNLTRKVEFPNPPAHLLRRSDLSPTAQAAQHPGSLRSANVAPMQGE